MKTVVILACLLVGLIRPVLLFRTLGTHAQKSYEAVAHLLVGGLFGAWWMSDQHWMLAAFTCLTLVEIYCGILVPLGRKLFR